MHPVAALLWIVTSAAAGAFGLLFAHLLPLPSGMEMFAFVVPAGAVFAATKPFFYNFLVTKTTTAGRSGIDMFRRDAAAWRTSAFGWSILHYGFGIIGIVSSGLAAAHPDLLIKDASKLQAVSFVAAVTTALITFLGAQAKATRYRAAAASLEVSVSRYDVDTTITFNMVAAKHDECEKLLKSGK